jgi:hypothetical protein
LVVEHRISLAGNRHAVEHSLFILGHQPERAKIGTQKTPSTN